MKPSVGRIVHYTPNAGGFPQPCAAIITEAHEFECQLYVFLPAGWQTEAIPSSVFAKFSEEPKAGHWNWPTRVG